MAEVEQRGPRDPFWDLEGVGVRRRRARRRTVSALAFLTALTAAVGAAALWAAKLGLITALVVAAAS